ncbi:MAG TPA: nuclear transport factor 2 family protein [Candidatus Limnocylindrales bacterium]
MVRLQDLDAAIEAYHEADAQIIRGNTQPYRQVYSHRDDATLANPFGGIWRGWAQIREGLDRAASLYRDGEFIANDTMARYVSGELAYLVEFQRFTAKLGGDTEPVERVLRTTSVLRREEDGWRVVHRHADPRGEARAPDSEALT